jgi:hypothetical protein
MIALNMTAYPSVRKPALEAPEPVELEFARDRQRAVKQNGRPSEVSRGDAHTLKDLGPARPRQQGEFRLVRATFDFR